MKKFIASFILVIAVTCVSIQEASAQKQYKYSYKEAPTTLTSALTVSVTPYASFKQYELAADTNIIINVVKTYALPGDMISFKIKANTRNRTITFGTNIEAAASTITSTKTVTYLFFYNGTYYYACGSFAAD